MAERRSLIEGIKNPNPPVDPEKEKAFVFRDKKDAKPDEGGPPMAANTSRTQSNPSRVPLSTRIRADFAAALKRASLERQLEGIEPNTLQDILEQAIEPWLRDNGYLK
ncbi:hypothetical protein [Tautonia rosea]|uniref:hypothetical protein n=1 Tax=Tautonia rosea TaxID=2728037 RepID=UPI001475EC1D|nr:hypothetical protein [Tautonia rosea]